MRGTSRNLGRRWQKAAALTLTMSLLNQQGLLISEACAQAVVGRAASGAVVAPVVPVVPVAPAFTAPALSPLTAPTFSPTPALSLPTPVTPTAAASAAAVRPSAVLPALAAPAAPAAVAASPAATPAISEISLTLPASESGRGEKAAGTVGALRELGKDLAKGRGRPATSLSLAFDGAGRARGNAVTEPVGRGTLGRAVSAARNGLVPASEETKADSNAAAAVPVPSAKRRFIEFNVQYLKDIKKLFLESATKPNKQDYMFLVTKTFGLNLAIRAAFAIKGVNGGDLSIERAILSTAWYQVQDAVFTVFGQTYMKFLGKMTGLLRIGPAKLGDLLFVYVQLVGFEFLNRLVLGPIGENPLVYSWGGIGLLLLNNLQGMVSGGLMVPVINKLRAAGYISDKTSNYLYQAASLTMHLGLLATFGYQSLFTLLTTVLMVLSWTAYIGLSFFAKPKPGLEPKL